MNTITRCLCLASFSIMGLATSPLIAQDAPTKKTNHTNHTNHGGVEPSSVRAIPAGTRPGSLPSSVNDPKVDSIMVFESTTAATGDILDNKPVDLEFVFKNAGTEPLEILFIKPACGCTVPEMEKTVYEPNEKGTIKVSFDPSGKSGKLSRTITIYTNSALKPVHSIFVNAKVSPVILTIPKVMSFEPSQKGEERTREFLIYGRFEDFKVSRATTQNPETFEIEIVDGGEVDKYGEKLWLQKIIVTLKDTASPKNHLTEITVRTNDKDKPIFSLPVRASVMGDLEMSPVRMTMGRLVVGDEFEREITLRSRSGSPFTIKSVNSTNVALDANFEFEPVDPEKRTEWIVRLKGSVINPAPRFKGKMHIVTDIADEQMVTVQMYGQLQPKPATP